MSDLESIARPTPTAALLRKEFVQHWPTLAFAVAVPPLLRLFLLAMKIDHAAAVALPLFSALLCLIIGAGMVASERAAGTARFQDQLPYGRGRAWLVKFLFGLAGCLAVGIACTASLAPEIAAFFHGHPPSPEGFVYTAAAMFACYCASFAASTLMANAMGAVLGGGVLLAALAVGPFMLGNLLENQRRNAEWLAWVAPLVIFASLVGISFWQFHVLRRRAASGRRSMTALGGVALSNLAFWAAATVALFLNTAYTVQGPTYRLAGMSVDRTVALVQTQTSWGSLWLCGTKDERLQRLTRFHDAIWGILSPTGKYVATFGGSAWRAWYHPWGREAEEVRVLSAATAATLYCQSTADWFPQHWLDESTLVGQRRQGNREVVLLNVASPRPRPEFIPLSPAVAGDWDILGNLPLTPGKVFGGAGSTLFAMSRDGMFQTWSLGEHSFRDVQAVSAVGHEILLDTGIVARIEVMNLDNGATRTVLTADDLQIEPSEEGHIFVNPRIPEGTWRPWIRPWLLVTAHGRRSANAMWVMRTDRHEVRKVSGIDLDAFNLLHFAVAVSPDGLHCAVFASDDPGALNAQQLRGAWLVDLQTATATPLPWGQWPFAARARWTKVERVLWLANNRLLLTDGSGALWSMHSDGTDVRQLQAER